MDIDYTQEIDYDFNDGNQEPFVYLEEFDEYLDELNLDFVYPFNSKIINFEDVGSLLVIISDEEIVNIKYTVNTDSHDKVPIKIKKTTKFTNIAGVDIISNQFHTYIHDKNGDLFKFRSAQSLDKVKHENILFLRYYNFQDNSCFVMISKADTKISLYIYDKSFDKEYSGYQKYVDLILPEDSIQTLENEVTLPKIKENFTFASEMLYNITENDLDVEFFNFFLGLDVKNENIRDILLVSMNDRLFYVKYTGTFDAESTEMGELDQEPLQLETVIVSRGRIKAIKYLNSSIMIIDEFWVLTIFYQCIRTNVIKRTEIPLGDEITCFEFTDQYLIYSNRSKIIFMKFKLAPSEPEVFEVDLSLVATFSIAQNNEFLIAIDKNKFFYYVPIPQTEVPKDSDDMNEKYEKVTKDDLKKFPDVLKYLENVEQDIKELSDTIEYESNMLLLLTHLERNDNVTSGSAKIKYLPFLTPSQEDDIICDPITLQSGHSFIRIVIELDRIFSAFKFTIAFYRHTSNKGVLLRHIEIEPRNDKTNFAIYVPDELNDHPDNKLELYANFYVNIKDECHTLQFPFSIKGTKVSTSYTNRQNIEINKCIKALNKLLHDDK
ncbi:uncharacterized protein [Chironomus tepperi]|uniref:uncharacterized protein n=1 Tax=Chironomus tepperi TaxID=113505 RepID=UPI00391F3F66